MNVSMKFLEHMDYIHNIPIQWRHIPFISTNFWTQPLFFSRSQICRKSSMKLDDALLKKNSPINSQLNHSPSPLKFLSFIIQQLSVPMISKNQIQIISTSSLLHNFPPIFPAFWPQLWPSRQWPERFMELLRAEELSNFLNRADNSSISREEISKLRGSAPAGATKGPSTSFLPWDVGGSSDGELLMSTLHHLYYWYTWNEMLYSNQVTLKRCRTNWIDQSFRIGTRNFFASFFFGRYNHSILSFQWSLMILILMVYK